MKMLLCFILYYCFCNLQIKLWSSTESAIIEINSLCAPYIGILPTSYYFRVVEILSLHSQNQSSSIYSLSSDTFDILTSVRKWSYTKEFLRTASRRLQLARIVSVDFLFFHYMYIPNTTRISFASGRFWALTFWKRNYLYAYIGVKFWIIFSSLFSCIGVRILHSLLHRYNKIL